MADKERKVAVDGRKVDSQLVITLYEGERVPEAHCTIAGRMTGQMIMGLEGAGIMQIDIELRRAQLEMRRAMGMMTPENRKDLIQRTMQTEENTLG